VSFSKKDILSSSIDNNKLKSNLLNKIGKAQKNIYTTKEENLNDLNNQYFNSQKILFDIKDEINKLSEGFNDPNKNNSKLSNRIKSLYKLNTEFNDNKNVIEKKCNNDFIQIPINDDNKNINYEFGIQHGNLLNDLI
jgi:DNA repair ATPase RecN